MKLNFDFDQIRVVSTTNCKGNPRCYLEIFGVRVLYADPHDMLRDDRWKYYVKDENGDPKPWRNPVQPEDVDTENLQEIFRHRIAYMIKDMLVKANPHLFEDGVWTEDADREIDYTKPRIEIIDEH